MRTRPDVITTIEVNGRKVRRDEHGYLIAPEEWGPDVAELIAEEEGLALAEDHWAVIDFMRSYIEEHGIAPDARFVFAHLGARHGETSRAGRKRFFELFPYGYVQQACKIAGMRQPRAWSSG